MSFFNGFNLAREQSFGAHCQGSYARGRTSYMLSKKKRRLLQMRRQRRNEEIQLINLKKLTGV
jgi:hypothetical protein